jgi:hypothetical protein
MPWKLVVLVEQMQRWVVYGGEVGAPPEAPWKLVWVRESDADATSTPGGGRTASIDAATTLCDDASAPAADSDAPVASADTTTAAYALSATAAALRQKEFIDGFMDPAHLPDLASAVREWLTQNAWLSGIVRIQPTLSQRDTQSTFASRRWKRSIPGRSRRILIIRILEKT